MKYSCGVDMNIVLLWGVCVCVWVYNTLNGFLLFLFRALFKEKKTVCVRQRRPLSISRARLLFVAAAQRHDTLRRLVGRTGEDWGGEKRRTGL